MIDYEGATGLDWLALVGAGSVLGVPVEWVTCFGGLVGVIHVDPVDAEPLLRDALDSAESRLRPSIGSPATVGEWVAAAVSDPTVVPLLQALTPPGRWGRPGDTDVVPLGWVDRETGRGGIVPVFGRSSSDTTSATTTKTTRTTGTRTGLSPWRGSQTRTSTGCRPSPSPSKSRKMARNGCGEQPDCPQDSPGVKPRRGLRCRRGDRRRRAG